MRSYIDCPSCGEKLREGAGCDSCTEWRESTDAELAALRAERDQLLAEKAQANFSASHPDAMKKMYRINQRLREALKEIADACDMGDECRLHWCRVARTALDPQG